MSTAWLRLAGRLAAAVALLAATAFGVVETDSASASGVDTHRDSHVAAVIDAAGRLLGTASFAATGAGCGELLGWMRGWGDVERVGVEGTGSYGAGLARHLAAAGVATVEVIRPSRRAWSSSAAATWRSATGTGRRDLAAGSRRRTYT